MKKAHRAPTVGTGPTAGAPSSKPQGESAGPQKATLALRLTPHHILERRTSCLSTSWARP